MGLLDKLWDETLAGPTPETGLGKLRKYPLSPVRPHRAMKDDSIAVTRSITILKGSGTRKSPLDQGSAPCSPAGSSEPGTPLTPGSPSADFKRFARSSGRRKSSNDYDWILLNALDR